VRQINGLMRERIQESRSGKLPISLKLLVSQILSRLTNTVAFSQVMVA
jgi:hypothetical protein